MDAEGELGKFKDAVASAPRWTMVATERKFGDGTPGSADAELNRLQQAFIGATNAKTKASDIVSGVLSVLETFGLAAKVVL